MSRGRPRHQASRRRNYSPREHDVQTRPASPPIYRCTVCGELGFDRIRLDNLFGYCRTCRLHRTFAIATDPDALRWQRIRAGVPRQDRPARDSDIDVLSSEGLQ